jgi:hypothetical protein
MQQANGLRSRSKTPATVIVAGAFALAAVMGAVLLRSELQPAAAAGTGGIAVSPASQQVLQGSGPFGVDINAVGVSPVGSFDFKIQYNPQVLSFFGLAVGPFLSSTGRPIFCPPAVVDNLAGTVQFSCASSGATPAGPTGSGRLATLAFAPVATGTSPLTFINTLNSPYSDEGGDAFTVYSFSNGSVDVLPNNGTPLPTSTQTLTPTITPTTGPTLSPTPTPTGIAPPGACGPQIAIAVCPQPAVVNGSVDAPLDVDIRVEDVANLGSFSVTVEYSNVVFPAPPSFTEGAFLGSSGRTIVCLLPAPGSGSSSATSTLRVNCVSLGAPPPAGTEPFGPAGSGVLGTFTFVPVVAGSTAVTLPAVAILDGYAINDPAGHSDTTQIVVGPQLTPTPCGGPCPTSTPTRTSTPSPVPTATDTGTPTRTPTRTATPCTGPCPTAEVTSTPEATSTPGPAVVRVEPIAQTVGTGAVASFGIFVDNAVNLGGFGLQLTFDPQLIAKVDIDGCLTAPGGCQPSPFLSGPDRHPTCFQQGGADSNAGLFGLNCVLLDPASTPGATGSGLLATVQLRGLAPAASALLHLQSVQLLTPGAGVLPFGGSVDGSVHIIVAPTATPCGGVCPTATLTPTSSPTATVAAGSVANISISPAQQVVGVGALVDLSVDVAAVQNLGSFQLQLQYDTQALEPISTLDGGFIGDSGRIVFCPPAIADSGTIRFGCATGGQQLGPSGGGSLASLRFRTLQQATVDLRLLQADLTDPAGNDIANTITDTADEILILNSLSTPSVTPTRTVTPGPTPTPANQQACVTQPGGSGNTCLVIDADPFTPGEQNALVVPATGTFLVNVVARNVSGVAGGLGLFNATVLYDPAFLAAGTPTSTLPVTEAFTCINANGRLPESDQFADGNPATGDAFINCFDPAGGSGPTGDVIVMTIPFTILASGSSSLRFFSSSVSDESGANIASCNPVDIQPGAGCLDGFVYNSGGGPTPVPTTPATVTPTATVAAPSATPNASGTPTAPNAVGGISIAPDVRELPAIGGRRTGPIGGGAWQMMLVAAGGSCAVAAVAVFLRRRKGPA